MSEEKTKLSRPLTSEEQESIYKYILSQQASDDDDIEVVAAKAPFNGNLQLYLRCHAEHCPGDLFPEINEMVKKIKKAKLSYQANHETIKNIIGDFIDFDFLIAITNYLCEEECDAVIDQREYWMGAGRYDGIGPQISANESEYCDAEIRSLSRNDHDPKDSIRNAYKEIEKIVEKLYAEKDFLSYLRHKLGKEIKLEIYSEAEADPGPFSKPNKSKSIYNIIFLGIYGFKKISNDDNDDIIYIHGKDLKDNKEKLFRNNSDMWSDEDTQRVTYRSKDIINKIDEVNIEKWFTDWIDDKNENLLRQRMMNDETEDKEDLENTVQNLIRGCSGFRKYTWSPTFSVFEKDEFDNFLDKVLKYFDRII